MSDITLRFHKIGDADITYNPVIPCLYEYDDATEQTWSDWQKLHGSEFGIE